MLFLLLHFFFPISPSFFLSFLDSFFLLLLKSLLHSISSYMIVYGRYDSPIWRVGGILLNSWIFVEWRQWPFDSVGLRVDKRLCWQRSPGTYRGWRVLGPVWAANVCYCRRNTVKSIIFISANVTDATLIYSCCRTAPSRKIHRRRLKMFS